MSDLISRQAAIDALTALEEPAPTARHLSAIYDCEDAIKALPSAQPEIIHCKECKYGVQDEDKRWYCRSLGCQIGNEDGSGYCADAERREDEH